MKMKKMRDLLVIFLKVKEKGWVKSLRKGTTGIGYTFETLIGKNEEQFPIADFEGIEIKVKKKYGYGNITLFNAVPDSNLFIIKRIYEKYSIFNRNMNYYKTFMLNINSIEEKKYGKHKFLLSVDDSKKIVKLNIYKLDGTPVKENISWSFNWLEEKINTKIKDLAIVKAEQKEVDGSIYYKYCYINFYEIKDMQEFINLIKQGIISVTFKISVYCSGEKTGQMNDHGVGFIIHEKNIEKLYTKKEFEKKTTNSRF